ncbi:MAG TPA: hypothetical protein VGE18_03095 [Candidatus Paceibacterota bacterium]
MKTRTKVLLIALATMTTLALFAASSLRAGTNSNASGNMWSSNIGWISLNNCTDPTNTSSCTGSDYGVSVDPASGAISGTAWSSNIGWITFSPAGCPTSGCTQGAYVDLAYPGPDGSYGIKGWARACSVFASGCSGALANNAYLGDWDGFLSLSGSGYGLTLGPDSGGTRTLTGSLWGSEVIGWTSVNGSVGSVSCPAGTVWSQGAPTVDPSFQCRPPVPAITASCPAPGDQITVTVAPVSGADWYSFRVNNLANGWEEGAGPCNNPGDSCWEGAATSYTTAGIPGASYGAWAHSRSPATAPFFSDAVSTSFSCEITPPDMCANIDGTQTTIPYGYTASGANCVQDDMCPNIDGAQQTIPTGYILEGGMCVKTTITVLPDPGPNCTGCDGVAHDPYCPDGSPIPAGGLSACPVGTTPGSRQRIIISRIGAGASCNITWGASTRTVNLVQQGNSGIWSIMSDIIVPPAITSVTVQCGSEAAATVAIEKKKPIFIEF